MTRSVTAVPSIAEVEILLAQIRELTNHVVTGPEDKFGPGIDQCWREADVVAKARGGGGGGTPIAEHDPVGEYVTDDARQETYEALRSAAAKLRVIVYQLKDCRAGLQGPAHAARRRAEMRNSDSYSHDEANRIAMSRRPSPTFERYFERPKSVGA